MKRCLKRWLRRSKVVDDNIKKYILNTFQNNAEPMPDEAYNDAEERIWSMLNDQELGNLVKKLKEYESEYDVDFSEIKEYVEVLNSDELFKTSEKENDKDESINDAVKNAVKSRISRSDKNNIVSYLNKECSNKTLRTLSKEIFYDYDKSVFFVSPNEQMEGRISMAITQTKDKHTLFEAYKTDDGMKYRFFGDSRPSQKKPMAKLVEGFMAYKFISGSEEYLALSPEKLEPQRCRIKGQVFRINDSKKVGDNRQLPTSQDIVFIHTIEPAVRSLSESELENVKNKYNHSKLANKLLGKFRHPDWFEKLLLALNMVNEENDFPSGFLWQAEPRTGKSASLAAMSKALDENKVFTGSNSTIKGLTPSFAEKPPKEGFLLKTQRIAPVDEFFNIIRNEIKGNGTTQDVFRPLLDLLTHKSVQFGSGNGSITAKMASTLMAATNPSYGIDNILDFVKKTDPAFAARLLPYEQTEQHIDYVNEQKKKYGNYSDEEMMPERDDEFISLIDTLKNDVHLNKELDMGKVMEIKDAYKNSVPAEMETIYKNGYDQHIKNLVCGVAKYNSIVNNRDSFGITEEDYDDVKKILEIIIHSWSESIKYDLMRPEVRVEYLKRRDRVIYELIQKNNKISYEDLKKMTDTKRLDRILDNLEEKEVVNFDGDYYTPYWYSGKTNI